MTNEATDQGEALRREVAAPNNARAGAEFLSGLPTREVLPAFFSVITSDSPLPEKLNAINNVKSALDNPEASGLRERITDSPSSFLNDIILGTKEVWMNPSPQALNVLETVRGNFQRGIKGSRTQTLGGSNFEILTLGVDGKYLAQAVMAGVFNADEPSQFREALFKTFLTWSANPTFQGHYFGPDAAFGEIDYTRERDRRAEEGQAERFGRRAGRAWRRRGELPGEALTNVRRRLRREEFIGPRQPGIVWRATRRSAAVWHGVQEAPGRVWNRITRGPIAMWHGVQQAPGRVGRLGGRLVDAVTSRFRRNPVQAPVNVHVQEQPLEGEFQEVEDVQPALEPVVQGQEGEEVQHAGEIDPVANLTDDQVREELRIRFHGQTDPNSPIEVQRARLRQALAQEQQDV